MPFEHQPVRSMLKAGREPYSRPFEFVVVLTIVKIVLKPSAHLKLKGRCDSDIASIEERMHVRSKQETVSNLVYSTRANWLDVSGIQNREGLLSRDGAPPLVHVRY